MEPYASPQNDVGPVYTAGTGGRATLVDIRMPFGRMILVMLKFMFASIPAVLLFYLIFIVLFLIVAGITGQSINMFTR